MRRMGLCILFLLSLGLALSATSAAGAGNRYALVIGINDYELLGKLDCAREDAEALADVLVQNCGFDPERLCLITDNPARGREFQPTFTNIQRRFQFFTSVPGDGDSLVVYFAGHGITLGNDGYLMPADGSDDRSGIAMTWLRDRLNACKATNKVLILDACHSGKLTRGVSGIAPTLATAPSVLVLASCKENEISYPEGKHGVFTAALLEGLNGKADTNQDKSLTGTELYSFVRDYMVKWSVRTAKVQTPQMTPADASGIQVASIFPRPVVTPPKSVVPAVPAVPVVPAPDPRLVLAKVYRRVADDLVSGDAVAAAKQAAEAKTDYVLSNAGKELADLSLQIGRMSTTADLVMGTFAADKSKEVKVELRAGTDSMLIENVAGRSVTAKRIIRTGSGSMQAPCNFGYADLSYREKAKRLARSATGPDAALLQGTLALENRQPAQAKKLFADSATELGKALAARLDEAEAKSVTEVQTAAPTPVPEQKQEKPDKRAPAKTGKNEKAEPKIRLKPATAAVVDAAMAELKKANPNEPDLKYRHKILVDGIDLNLTRDYGKGNEGLSDISPLSSLPLVSLVLAGSAVTDLQPLTGLPLTNLDLMSTPVEDLRPLKGMPIIMLYLVGTRVTDLSPLAGMPLEGLMVPPSFSDAQIPFIAEFPLTFLALTNSQVSNISGLRKLQLRCFIARNCRALRDLTPLQRMPLTKVEIDATPVENLAFLKTLDKLVSLTLSCTQFEAFLQLKPSPRLESMSLQNEGADAVVDLRGLTQFPRLMNIILGKIQILDLQPLAELRQLKTLNIGLARVTDISALAECKKLEVLTLPASGAENVDKLRSLPNLKTINGVPVAAFWKAFDAEKAAGGAAAGKRE